MSRFDALAASLARRHGVQHPAALAAWIGRRKYGNTGMRALSLHEQGKPKHKHRHVRQQAHDMTDSPPDTLSSYPQGVTTGKRKGSR